MGDTDNHNKVHQSIGRNDGVVPKEMSYNVVPKALENIVLLFYNHSTKRNER